MTGQSTSGVRKGHELDQTKLENYLLENIPGFKSPLSINQFQFGQSNPTFLLRDANQQQYVLRKKPPGALVSNTAHAIEREYQVIKALEKTEVPVPKVYVLCKDTNILGTPFYVMEFLKGRIFEDCRMLSLAFEERQALWHAAIKTLAQLHAVDFKRIGLESYGKQVGFYKRQMKSLARISDAQSKGELVDPIPRLDEIFSWFEKNQVKDEARLIHGDFKIDNLVYHPTEPRVIGILDWELSTIGHPYSDLSNLLQPYYIPSHSPAGLLGFKYATEIPVPPADELIQLYCAYTMRAFPLDRWTFAIAFSFFRLAVILQGIAARVVRKQASSAEAKVYAARFKPVCLLILDIIDQKSKL